VYLSSDSNADKKELPYEARCRHWLSLFWVLMLLYKSWPHLASTARSRSFGVCSGVPPTVSTTLHWANQHRLVWVCHSSAKHLRAAAIPLMRGRHYSMLCCFFSSPTLEDTRYPQL
jgi:hypothetical protein